MSSDASLTFDEGEEIPLADWAVFAAARGLTYDPHVIGRNTYRRHLINVRFGADDLSDPPKVTVESARGVTFAQFNAPLRDGGRWVPVTTATPAPVELIDFAAIRPPAHANRIVFSTYWMGEACPEVAALAVAAWRQFGGSLDACPEIRQCIGMSCEF